MEHGRRVSVRGKDGEVVQLGIVSKGRAAGCAPGRSHGTAICFQCNGKATSACAHLPPALGCACPSHLPFSLHSPPSSLPSSTCASPATPSITAVCYHPSALSPESGCGVSPLHHTFQASANPSLNPQNLLGAGIPLRLPHTHAFPIMLVPAACGCTRCLAGVRVT